MTFIYFLCLITFFKLPQTLKSYPSLKKTYQLDVDYFAKVATLAVEKTITAQGTISTNSDVLSAGTIQGFIGIAPSVEIITITESDIDKNNNNQIPSITIANTTTTLIVLLCDYATVPLITFPTNPVNGRKLTIINEFQNKRGNGPNLVITHMTAPDASIITIPSCIPPGNSVTFMYYKETKTWYRI